MNSVLNDIEVRVLGCLVEKDLATPEYYPLTLNALTNACNQKSNRDPVMALADTDVLRALDTLRFKGFAMEAGEGGRATKYAHSVDAKLHLDPDELALLAELLLRGPQTPGELRTHANRMRPFADLNAVEDTIAEMMERDEALIVKLPRQAGRKESRYAQLLAGEPELETVAAPPEAARLKLQQEDERIVALQQQLTELREELATLRQEFATFRKEFE